MNPRATEFKGKREVHRSAMKRPHWARERWSPATARRRWAVAGRRHRVGVAGRSRPL